jgi:hypothetical protein
VATTGLVQPQQIPAVKLWPCRRVVSGTPHRSVKPTLPLKCSMECPGEGRGGAGGPRRRRVPRRLGRLANTGSHRGSPGGLARNGAQDRGGIRRARPSPAWARRRRRGGGAGDLTHAGAWKRESDGMRGGVHARQVTTAGEQSWGRDGASRRCSRRSPARRHGWWRARRPRLARESACGFTAVAGRARGGQGQGAPFPPLLETEYGALSHGEAAAVLAGLGTAASPTRKDRGQGSTWTPGSTRARAGVHGGTGRRACEASRANASANSSARRRRREQHAWRPNNGEGRLGRWRALVGEGGSTCKKIASQPGSMAGITNGGAAARSGGRSASARRPWRPQGGGIGCPHLGGHLPKWSVSVKRGGTACRRGRRGGRRRRVVGEEGEVVEADVHGGSGSSLGRLRASRRTASPRAASLSSSFSSSPTPPADGVGRQGRLPWCG